MKFLIINGPNLNFLGIREPELYGKKDYAALVERCEESCKSLGVDWEIFQSNHEGAIVDKIQAAYGNTDGIIINPAAYTHTSVVSSEDLIVRNCGLKHFCSLLYTFYMDCSKCAWLME